MSSLGQNGEPMHGGKVAGTGKIWNGLASIASNLSSRILKRIHGYHQPQSSEKPRTAWSLGRKRKMLTTHCTGHHFSCGAQCGDRIAMRNELHCSVAAIL